VKFFYNDLYATKSAKITEDLEIQFFWLWTPTQTHDEIDKEEREGLSAEKECEGFDE